MLLFNSIVFGSFCGVILDYILGRFAVKDPIRIVIASVVAAIVAILVFNGNVSYF